MYLINVILNEIFLSIPCTISLDDFKNLWQIFEKLLFSVNDYDFVLGLLDDINAFDGWEIHILKINYH